MQTSGKKKIAFRVEESPVSGREPAGLESALRAGVAGHERRTADHDFAYLTSGRAPAGLISNGDFRSRRQSHRALLANAGRQRVAAYLMGRLRHPIGFNDGNMKGLFHFPHD